MKESEGFNGSAHSALNYAKVARGILMKMIKEAQNEKI
jgi:hypothetical protein